MSPDGTTAVARPGDGAATLYLVVDAIPHSMALRVWREGVLPGTGPPRRLIAPFPSSTPVSLTGLMRGIDPELRAPGYEERYLDTSTGELRGGIVDGLLGREEDFPYTAYFAVYEHSVVDQVRIYALPERAAVHDVRVIERHMLADSRQAWCGYVGGTDGAGHMGGAQEQERLFRAVLENLVRLRGSYREQTGEPLELVLASDHGFCHRFRARLAVAELEAALAEDGFRAGDTRPGPGEVVLSPWGMIGGAALYCREADRLRVARRAVELPLVQLAVADLADQGLVVMRVRDDRREEAWVRCDADLGRFGYEPRRGDPLDLAEVWRLLSELGRLDERGFARERDLFEATWAGPFPDAPYRLCDSFRRIVRHAPGVALSMHDDAAFGSDAAWRAAKVLGGLRGTHGNLGRRQSLGFFLTTLDVPGLHPHAVRYDQALRATMPDPAVIA